MKDNEPEPPVIRKKDDFSHSVIFKFHSEIPKFKFFILPKQFNESPIRPAIMKVLREGIHSEAGIEQPRYALNAQEIKERLSTFTSPEVKDVTYTNLYFHLKKLLEAGVIQIIAYIIERNHRIAFYGRTARLILHGDPSSELKKIKSSFEELAKLVKILNPEIDTKIFEQLPEQYLADEDEKAIIIAKWMAMNDEIITENGLSFDEIFSALKKILKSGYIENESLRELMELLKLLKR